MSDKINMDELLKQELGNMAPEPPAGVWESVSNQVQVIQPVNPAATAAKTVLAGSKAIITATVVAVTSIAGFVGYKLYNANEPGVRAVENKAVEAPAISKTPLQPEQKTEERMVTSEDPVVPASRKASKKEKQINTPVTEADSAKENTVSPPASETGQPDRVADVTDPLVNNNQVVKSENDIIQNQNSQEKLTPPLEAEEQKQEFEVPFVPNVFTPNMDGKNDEFAITIENEVLYDLKITDRNGNIVFESKDKNVHWQGINMYSGKPCDEGMYIYAFKYQLKGMKEAGTKSGWINLRLSPRQ